MLGEPPVAGEGKHPLRARIGPPRRDGPPYQWWRATCYVREYVRNKCGTICKDVETVHICADPLIRYHLLKFCMNTLLSFLSRNVTPDNMASSSTDPAHIGPVHVDQKIVKEVLSAVARLVLPQETL